MTLTLANHKTADGRKYAVLTEIPNAAHETAKKVAGAKWHEAEGKLREIYANKTPPCIGAEYLINVGKHRGVRGVLTWVGKTRWGNRYAIATSNEKLPNGRYRDTVFVRPNWARQVDVVRDARIAELNAVMANHDKHLKEVYKTELLRLYREAAAAWGVSETVLLNRAVEVMEERVASIKEYDSQNCENHWACDGPAYDQVLRQSERCKRDIDQLTEIVTLLKTQLNA